MSTRRPVRRAASREGARRRRLPSRPQLTNDVHAVTLGTLAWGVAALALLPFWNDLVAADRGWWLWTCVAGIGLGLFGVDYCRRQAVVTRTAAAATTPAGATSNPTLHPVGDAAEAPSEPPSSQEAPPATPQHH